MIQWSSDYVFKYDFYLFEKIIYKVAQTLKAIIKTQTMYNLYMGLITGLILI